MKKCSKCKESLELSKFGKNKNTGDGLQVYCKPCRKVISNNFYKKNIVKIKNRSLNYYKNNVDKCKKKAALYRNNNLEKCRNSCREWRKLNPEKHKESCKNYRLKNLTYNKLYHKNYHQNNKGKIKGKVARYRATKLNATPKWSEIDKIKIVYEKAIWLESITGLKYEVDHVIPLQGKNVCGLHVWENLQILEMSLNRSKSNKG